jgi:hypothetical protein
LSYPSSFVATGGGDDGDQQPKKKAKKASTTATSSPTAFDSAKIVPDYVVARTKWSTLRKYIRSALSSLHGIDAKATGTADDGKNMEEYCVGMQDIIDAADEEVRPHLKALTELLTKETTAIEKIKSSLAENPMANDTEPGTFHEVRMHVRFAKVFQKSASALRSVDDLAKLCSTTISATMENLVKLVGPHVFDAIPADHIAIAELTHTIVWQTVKRTIGTSPWAISWQTTAQFQRLLKHGIVCRRSSRS